MESKIFDIPFRIRTPKSDFICPDGEIFRISNARILCEGKRIDTDLYLNQTEDRTGDIPVPSVTFALIRDILPGWHISSDTYPQREVAASDPSMEYWTAMASQLLNLFTSEARNANLFVAPFYIMAAWRMTDGNFVAPSSPQLLIPNSEVPLVATDGDISASDLYLKIAGAVCRPVVKTVPQEELRDWVGKIASLEIFVSAPLHNYDTIRAFIPQRRATSSAYCESLDLYTRLIEKKRICTDILPLAWKAYTYGAGNLEQSEGYEDKKFYRYASVPLRDIDLLWEWKSPGENGPGVIVYGIDIKGISFGSLSGMDSEKTTSQTVVIEGTGSEFSFTTRPLKLSGAGKLKEARKVFLRGNYTPGNIRMKVYASRDMLRWWEVAKMEGGTMALLPRSSFRFFRIELSGYLAEGDTLEGLTII